MPKVIFKVIIAIFSVSYPFLVFAGLVYFKASPRVLALGLLVLGLAGFLLRSDSDKKEPFKKYQSLFLLLAAMLISVLTIILDGTLIVKFYPVVINLFLLSSFLYTLFVPPVMILRFAMLQDKSIAQSPEFERIRRYCTKVTIIWSVFFFLNAFVSVLTAFLVDDFWWALYNGLLSYILIGILLAGEFVYRKLVLKV